MRTAISDSCSVKYGAGALGRWLNRLPAFQRFVLLGGVAAGVNAGSRFALSPWLGFELAVAVAYVTGMVVAYLLFRRFVFGASDRGAGSEVWRFTIVNLIALVIVWCVSVGLARVVFPAIAFTWHAEDIAHLIGIAAPVVTSFIGHKRYTFGSR